MDSSEEITDDILSYLLGNHTCREESDCSLIIEGANVSTATYYNNEDEELDTSQNPSLTSAYSAKKLEWDSSADVGCLPIGRKEFKTRLSTLEKMALSNSASKLCLDEDEQSLALIAKIDKVLAKSKIASKSNKKSLNKVHKLPTWPSVDSASNASQDTVIPIQHSGARHHSDVPVKTKKDENTQTESTSTVINNFKSSSRSQKRIHESENHLKPTGIYLETPTLRRSKMVLSCTPSEEVSSELFITRSVASEEHDLYASNSNLQPSSIPVTPTNFATADDQNINVSHQCICVSGGELSETCPTHTSLSTEHTRRLRSEALGELQVYRGLKEHLKSLKDYVVQLEETWKFLERAKSSAPLHHKGQISRRSKAVRVHPTVPAFPDLPLSSSCSHFSSVDDDDQESSESLARCMSPNKSDRSFELERLNLHDTDSASEQPTNSNKAKLKKTKPKCCAHCSLKWKSTEAPAQVVPGPAAQREPIAYDIGLHNGDGNNKESGQSSSSSIPRVVSKSGNKTSLQQALKERRPDFYQESERRRRTIKEITLMRRDYKMDCNSIPRLFTYSQLRQHTENIYRHLPEAQYRYKDQNRKDIVTSNRIKASVFQKKLQSRVLQGQLNLPHSTCL